MTSVFCYRVTVTSKKEITPNITGSRIENILSKEFKDGKCEVELLSFEGKP